MLRTAKQNKNVIQLTDAVRKRIDPLPFADLSRLSL